MSYKPPGNKEVHDKVSAALDTHFAAERKFIPVFSGRTPEGEMVVVYKHVDNEDDIHIQRPDGQLWALSPEAKVVLEFDRAENVAHVSIESPEWTGTASGTKHDLLEAEPR